MLNSICNTLPSVDATLFFLKFCTVSTDGNDIQDHVCVSTKIKQLRKHSLHVKFVLSIQTCAVNSKYQLQFQLMYFSNCTVSGIDNDMSDSNYSISLLRLLSKIESCDQANQLCLTANSFIFNIVQLFTQLQIF